MAVFVLTAVVIILPTGSSAQGSLLTLPSTEVHVTVGETARISCSYPIISGHSYPLIKINNDPYISVSDIRRMPELGYTASAVPNSNGSQCIFTLSYNGVRNSDNGTSYQFLVFIGGPLETESAAVVLFVHEAETPSSYTEDAGSSSDKGKLASSQTATWSVVGTSSTSVLLTSSNVPPEAHLSTTTIIVIGAVCGGVCMIMLVLIIMIPASILIYRLTMGSRKNGLSVKASKSSDSEAVTMDDNPAYGIVEYATSTSDKAVYANL